MGKSHHHPPWRLEPSSHSWEGTGVARTVSMLPTYSPVHSVYILPHLSANWLKTYLIWDYLAHLPAFLPACPPAHLPTRLPACLLACLPIYLPTYLPTHLPASLTLCHEGLVKR